MRDARATTSPLGKRGRARKGAIMALEGPNDDERASDASAESPLGAGERASEWPSLLAPRLIYRLATALNFLARSCKFVRRYT